MQRTTGVLQEIISGQQAPILFGLSLLVVFLALAALYENWSVPAAVMLVVLLGILGTLSFTWLRGPERAEAAVADSTGSRRPPVSPRPGPVRSDNRPVG